MTRIVFIGGGQEPLSLIVQEELSAAVAAMRGSAEFRRFTDPAGRLHWVNSAAVAYIEEYDGPVDGASGTFGATPAVPARDAGSKIAGSTV